MKSVLSTVRLETPNATGFAGYIGRLLLCPLHAFNTDRRTIRLVLFAGKKRGTAILASRLVCIPGADLIILRLKERSTIFTSFKPIRLRYCSPTTRIVNYCFSTTSGKQYRLLRPIRLMRLRDETGLGDSGRPVLIKDRPIGLVHGVEINTGLGLAALFDVMTQLIIAKYR